MSESKQPFTEHVSRAKDPLDISKPVWIGGSVLVLLVLAACLWAASRQHRSEMEALRAKLADATAALATAQSGNAASQEKFAALQAQIADLQKEKEQVGQAAKSLEGELRADLESKDVTISKLQGKLTVNILDRILFDSGEAVLKTDGEAVLQKIAAILASHPTLKIHVIGHTDNVPIRAGARSRFASNWELSTARALAAVRFLTERAGVDPRRLGAVGYGEFRPIADNATPEGRARNRRIAITILPDELAGADTVPAANAVAPVNSPPSTPMPEQGFTN